MNITTIAARGSAALVAIVAGYSSFSHIAHVALSYGERREVAYALPWAIDGLLIVATMAMVEDKRNRRVPRLSAKVAFAFGVLASLAANVASAQPTTGARIVAAVPAVALLLAVEVLSRVGRPLAEPVPDVAATVTAPMAAAVPVMTAPPVAGTAPELPSAAPRPAVASAPALAMATPAKAVSARVSAKPAPATETAARVAELAARTSDITAAAVASALGVSDRTARRYLSAQRGQVATVAA